MRITAKGQVTIPHKIRLRLGLQPKTEVEVDVVENTVRIRKVGGRSSRGCGIIDRLRGRATTRLTTDQILALTRRG